MNSLRWIIAPIAGLALAAFGSTAVIAQEQAPRELSEAERLIWMKDQLGNIDEKCTLHYSFERRGSLDVEFSDTVDVDLVEVHPDGTKAAQVEFLSDDNRHPVEMNESTTENPVLIVFLTRDVLEMQRMTDGSAMYFKQRVQAAFADGAKVSPVTVDYNGGQVDAKQIRLDPFTQDPNRARFEQFADKYYLITMSDEIPGQFYEIRTVVPGKGANGEPTAEPLLEERLTLVGVDYK